MFEKINILTWLSYDIFRRMASRQRTIQGKSIHVMIGIMDHFEPFNGKAGFEVASQRVDNWLYKYPEFADKHCDADGKKPQHTWFYPPHHDKIFLKSLVQLCIRKYGEIEMHLHHNHMEPFPDTQATLERKILQCIEDYSKYGIFCPADGTRRFGFIHGDWSLANSRGAKICGVNNEISILHKCGCYADFTFPCLNEAQPAMVNSIYYVKNNQNTPKPYNCGKAVTTVEGSHNDFMLVPGIIGLCWKRKRGKLKFAIEASNIDATDTPTADRIDYWIKNGLSVKGQPNWKFIKLHTHGALEKSWDNLFGGGAHDMFAYLEKQYNDGRKYLLHYVTAREMYNIIKAAEAGKDDDPGRYRDYVIPSYQYSLKSNVN